MRWILATSFVAVIVLFVVFLPLRVIATIIQRWGLFTSFLLVDESSSLFFLKYMSVYIINRKYAFTYTGNRGFCT